MFCNRIHKDTSKRCCNLKRVVVTGMSAVTPIGDNWPTVLESLKAGRSGIQYMESWSDIKGLGSLLAAPVSGNPGQGIPRKMSRSMSRVSRIAGQSALEALKESQINLAKINPEHIGIAYGSSFGAADQLVPFSRVLSDRVVRGISPTGYIKLMGHTTAINLSLLLGVRGRLIPTSSACASGGLAMGYAYETIKQGIHPIMIAGSAEELSPPQTAVFDAFFAASRDHANPQSAARPFANDRSGLVIGEGGASFILEDLDHALDRGAPILAEVVGFATNLDGHHIVKQDPDRMQKVIEAALASAELKKDQIGYINAHASGVDNDALEAKVVGSIFGSRAYVGSTKGHTGHTLGGCGAIESWLSIRMMNQEWYAPTLNLNHIGDDCDVINHIEPQGLSADFDYVMNNNFAFGGVNVSIIFKRWRE